MYSNQRYKRYTPKLILPPQGVPDIKSIEEIQPVKEIQPINRIISLTDKQRVYENIQQKQQTFLSNYNDPTELNSYIDALTNREAVSKKFGDTWGTVSTASGFVAVLSFAGAIISSALAAFIPATAPVTAPLAAGLYKTAGVAALPAVPAAIDVTVEKGIKPIIAGKPKEALLNTLMNLGETMDAVANPVKGLILEGPEGFAKGTGLADGGRVNYDYDTGFFLTDMALEILTDPMNWVDFGAGMALKTATKEAVQPMVKEMMQNFIKASPDITKEAAERLEKKLTKSLTSTAREWAQKNLDLNKQITKLTEQTKRFPNNKKLANQLEKVLADQQVLLKQGKDGVRQSFYKQLQKELPKKTPEELNALITKAGRNIKNGQFTKSIKRQVTDLTFDTLSTDVIKGVAQLQDYSNSFQRFLTKGAMMTSGFGLGVEAARNGWRGLKAWQNNYTLTKLEKLQVFDRNNGLDVKQWEKAKSIWNVCHEYTSEITKSTSQRDMRAFYTFANEQFSRDAQDIKDILLKYYNKPNQRIAALDANFQTRYKLNFDQYIEQLKTINNAENGRFTHFITEAEYTLNNIKNIAFAKQVGGKAHKISEIFPEVKRARIATLEKVVKLATQKNPEKMLQQWYTLKLNNAFVNASLLENPEILQAFTEISSSKEIGELLERIITDSNALELNAKSQIEVAARTIKEAGVSFMNIKNLYDDIGQVILPTIRGIKKGVIKEIDPVIFKRYIIDQIFGLQDDVSVLLAGLDNTTQTVLSGLKILCEDVGFNPASYPGLEVQIKNILKRFLEKQQLAGITKVNATIVEDFTKSIDDIIQYLPGYKNELMGLVNAKYSILDTLKNVKATNQEYLMRVSTSVATIFDVANTRQLTDAGLALKVIADRENLKYFNITKNMPGNVMKRLNDLGKAIKHNSDAFKQYVGTFSKEDIGSINQTYNLLKKVLKDNEDFMYITNITEPADKFAVLVEFNKLAKQDPKVLGTEFRNVTIGYLTNNVYQLMNNPSKLFNTDFAWEPYARSVAQAEKRFNEGIINTMQAYNNLSLIPKKVMGDFQALRDILSKNKLDRVAMVQQERYIRTIKKYVNFFDKFEKHYYSLYNKTIAEEQIQALYNAINTFPELQGYSGLVEKLKQYWRGEIEFKQDKKEYIKLGRTPDGSAAIDEFTPFYEQIKAMNVHMARVLRDYNIPFTPIDVYAPFTEQQQLQKVIANTTDSLAKANLHTFLQTPAKELTQEIALRGGIVTFTQADIDATKNAGALFKRMKDSINKEEIFYGYDEGTKRHWLILEENVNPKKEGKRLTISGRDVYYKGNPITKQTRRQSLSETKLIDQEIADVRMPKLSETIAELDDDIYDLTGSRIGYSSSEIYTKDMYRALTELDTAGKPKYITNQKIYDKLVALNLDEKYFDYMRFNESILGLASSKRQLGLYSSNIIDNTKNSLTYALGYLKPKNEYVSTVFNSQFSIGNPNSIWAKFSDNDLYVALQTNPDYCLIALVDDKKYGVKARVLTPTSPAVIAKAREVGAVIVPQQVAKDMYNVVNHRLGSEGFAKLWSRIMYIYKFGYLCRPGAWIRNFIDTNIKSKLEMGDEFASYKAQAHKILNDVDALKNYIRRVTRNEIDPLQGSAKKTIKQITEDWFAEGNAKYLTLEQYTELNKDFLSQGISGNIMGDLLQDTAGGQAWQQFTRITGNIIDLGNKTENYNRLAMYLYELDKGLDYTGALAKLAKTHFDYSFKTVPEQLLDMVFPFATFSLRNYSYWVEALERQPWLMRQYVHLMKPHWDFKDYTPEELARDYRVQTQILYGQLKLAEFNNKVITFKANPSIQDAIQMFSDPINNVYEKLAAPISIPLKEIQGEYTQPNNLIPVLGPALQSLQTMYKTKTPLPSAIGVSPIPKRTGVKFSNGNYKGINEYRDDNYRTPKYRNNVVYDGYRTRGVRQYRMNFYPIVDIAHEIRMRYNVNVSAKIKNRIKTDVYNQIRYRIRTDSNIFR